MLRKILTAAALSLALPFAAAQADTNLTITDLGTVDLGTQIATSTDSFVDSSSNVFGTLTDLVYFNSNTNVYTYVEQVAPSINEIHRFNTAFVPLGFNGTGGYSFSDAASAGTSFTLSQTNDGRLAWDSSNDAFGIGDSIRFFFQSSLPPDSGNSVYNLINQTAGSAHSFAPVPEPASLGVMGLLALAAGRIRGKRD